MPDLEVTVGADVSELLTKLGAAKAKLNQLTESQQELKTVITDLNTSFRLNEKELTVTNTKLQALNTTTKAGKAAAVVLRAELGQLAANSNVLSKSLTTAKNELANTTAALKIQTREVKAAETASGGFGKGLSKVYGGLRTLANIIPGIGIGGLVALIAGPLIDAFEHLTSSISPVLKAQRDLNLALAEASGSVTGEVTQLQSLVSIAKDTSLSYGARTQAIKELNKEYPELHGNITLENVNTAAVTVTINKEIEAIKRRAQAKALEKLIDEESIKVEKARSERADKLIDQNNRQNSSFAKGVNKIADALGAPGLFAEASDAADAFDESIAAGTIKLDLYSKKLNDLNKESAVAGTLFDDNGKKVAKTAKAIETISDVLKKVKHDLDVISKEEILFNTDKAKEKIGVLDGAIKHLFDKFNLPGDNSNVIDLKFQINDIEEREKLRKLMPELIKRNPLEIPLTVTGPTPIVLAKTLKPVSDAVILIANTVNDLLSPALDAFFETLTTGGKNAFQSFALALGQMLKQLVLAVAKSIILGVIFSAITGKTFSISSAFTSALSGHKDGGLVKGHAAGGLINGPGSGTSDSILARVSHGEYIMRADIVNRFGKSFFDAINRGYLPPKFSTGGSIGGGSIGGGQAIEVYGQFEMRGNTAVALVKRGNQTISRNG